jgi:hypothetical protein
LKKKFGAFSILVLKIKEILFLMDVGVYGEVG